MKNGISINERIKDLRNNNHMHLDDVTAATGIPKQTLGNYEKESDAFMQLLVDSEVYVDGYVE